MKKFTKTNRGQSQMKKVQQQFENWRKNRKTRRCPIPESLWKAAVNLHGKYSVYEIAKTLRLDYSKLKSDILNTPEKKEESTPAFIQLALPTTEPKQSQWLIEMENADGAKMKISGTFSQIPDIALICQNFLGSNK